MKDHLGEIFPYFVQDVKELSAQVRQRLDEAVAGEQRSIGDAINAVHALKGAAGIFKQEEIRAISTDLEVLLEVALSLAGRDDPGCRDVCDLGLQAIAIVSEIVSLLEADETEAISPLFTAFRDDVHARYGRYFPAEGGDGPTTDDSVHAPEDSVEIDPEVVECFREEAEEILAEIESSIGSAAEGDFEAISRLAKGFHTLKGSSGLAGLIEIQELAREKQDALEDLVESGEGLSEGLLEGVCETVEVMRSILAAAVTSVAASAGQGPAGQGLETVESEAETVDADLVEIFVEETSGYVAELGQLIPQLRARPERRLVERASALFHTIKGSAGLVGLASVGELAKDANEYLENCLAEDSWSDEGIPERIEGYLAGMHLGETKRSTSKADAIEAYDRPGTTDDIEFFAQETREHIEAIIAQTLEFERKGQLRCLEEVFRLTHTIKGASTLVGLEKLVVAAGAVEDFLQDLVQQPELRRAPGVVDVLFDGADTFSAVLAQFLGHEFDRRHADRDVAARVDEFRGSGQPSIEVVELSTSASRLFEAAPATVEETEYAVADGQLAASGDTAAPKIVPVADLASEAAKAAASTGETDSTDDQIIRVNAKRLNELMNLVGELIISRTRMASRIAYLDVVRRELSARKDRLLELVSDFQLKYEFGRGVGRNRIASTGSEEEWSFSDLEFDRYDDFNILSRGLIEISSDVSEIMSQLDFFFGEMGEESTNFSKVISNMQYEVTQIRMVPAATLFQRLSRPIRDAARHEGKRVEVVWVGEETELDKAIVDDLFKPFLHLVRNAVSHGIEMAQDRLRGSKPEIGTLLLKAFQEGNYVVIEVQDDGGGVDLAAVRRRGIEMGFLDPSTQPTREDLLALIFKAGFSTKSTVSAISGRGVGMDAVANAIRALSGTISIQTAEGVGTKFTVRLPLTLAINQALTVQVGAEQFTLPLHYIEEAIVVARSDVETISGADVLRIRGAIVPVVEVARVLRLSTAENADVGDMMSAVIVNVEDRRVALLVDRVVAKQEIVVKSCGRFMKDLGYISGGTIGGDGRVSFILDVPEIVGFSDRVDHDGSSVGEHEEETVAPSRSHGSRSVLVVDDSISVRKVASRFLEQNGFRVDLAVDGLNALELIREGHYTAVVTDLEMPRMHGYELIAELRRNEGTKDLPIIVITSRTGDKHMKKALELGANSYVGKPFTQNELLAAVKASIDTGHRVRA